MLLDLYCRFISHLHTIKHEQTGQGTTEYAVLVGVLVVIAIVAIGLFREHLDKLWHEISNSINSL